jgi:hypothetical protein
MPRLKTILWLLDEILQTWLNHQRNKICMMKAITFLGGTCFKLKTKCKDTYKHLQTFFWMTKVAITCVNMECVFCNCKCNHGMCLIRLTKVTIFLWFARSCNYILDGGMLVWDPLTNCSVNFGSNQKVHVIKKLFSK